jgi:hypothetical protein
MTRRQLLKFLKDKNEPRTMAELEDIMTALSLEVLNMLEDLEIKHNDALKIVKLTIAQAGIYYAGRSLIEEGSKNGRSTKVSNRHS